MNKQIEDIKAMARAIYETGEAIEEIDLRYACLHGADSDSETKFMRIARHLYSNDYRKIYDDNQRQCACYTLGCQIAENLKRDVARELSAENERLMREKTALECVVATARNQSRSEAITEFAERLKQQKTTTLGSQCEVIPFYAIDQIAKEMGGGTDAEAKD